MPFRIQLRKGFKQDNNLMLDFWQGLCDVYSTIPKSWEWLIVNRVVNVGRATLFAFCIFRDSRMLEDYIKLCRLETFMAMLKKVWMTTYLFN